MAETFGSLMLPVRSSPRSSHEHRGFDQGRSSNPLRGVAGRGLSRLPCAAGGGHCAPPLAAEPTPAQLQFFENRIRPVLSENCYKCHSAQAEKVKGRLLLDSREGVLKGGDTGPAIVPGDPESSLLIKAVRYTDPDLQMPPKNKKLSDEQIASLETWVKMGAPDPRVSTGPRPLTDVAEARARHWAFQPVNKPAPPRVKNS